MAFLHGSSCRGTKCSVCSTDPSLVRESDLECSVEVEIHDHTQDYEEDTLPAWINDMFDQKRESKHRSKDIIPIYPACVARPVGKKELEGTPKALEARVREWANLANKNTWNLKRVREGGDVAREARMQKCVIHLARVFGICVEKCRTTF